MKEDRRAYLAPKLTELGRIEELTGLDPKDIGLSDGFFLLSTGDPLCQPGKDCFS